MENSEGGHIRQIMQCERTSDDAEGGVRARWRLIFKDEVIRVHFLLAVPHYKVICLDGGAQQLLPGVLAEDGRA